MNQESDRRQPNVRGCFLSSMNGFHRILYLFVFVYAALFAVEKIYNYDIWWHLRTGEWIVQELSVPYQDPFSFTTPGEAWQPHYWLSDVMFYLVHQLTGLNGLILFKALVIGLAFLIILKLMLRSGVHPCLASILIIPAVYAARYRFLLRPHIFMFLFAAILVYVLTLNHGKKTKRDSIVLIVLFLAWTNMHASFALGLVLVFFWALEGQLDAIIQALRGKQPFRHRFSERFVMFFILLPLTFINPFGYRLWQWVLTDFTAKSVSHSFQIQEHIPLKWGEYPVVWMIMIAAGLSFIAAGKKIRVFHLLAFAATLFLAVRSVRYGALAVLLHLPILAVNASVQLNRIRVKVTVPKALASLLFILILTVVSVFFFRSSFSPDKSYRFGLGIMESRFPVEALPFFRDHIPSGNIYNSWEFGGYLQWYLKEKPTFIDGRCLGEQLTFMDRFNAMSRDEIDTLFEELSITSGIVYHRDSLAISYFSGSNDYGLSYFDDNTMIYFRKTSHSELTGVTFISLIHPETFDFSYLTDLARSSMRTGAEAELRRAIELAPGSFKAQFFLGFFLESAGNPSEALAIYTAAAKNNPRLANVHYGLGIRAGTLALGLKQWDSAIFHLEQSLEFTRDGETYFLLGTAFYQSGDLDSARVCYEAVLTMDPNQVPTIVNLAYLYYDRENYDKAESLHRRALEVQPDREDAHFGLALTLMKKGENEEAIRLFRTFLNTHPQSRLKPRVIQHLNSLQDEGISSK